MAKRTPQLFKQTDLERAIRAATAGGLVVKAVEIAVDGALRILTAPKETGVGVNDDDDWVSLAGSTQDPRRA